MPRTRRGPKLWTKLSDDYEAAGGGEQRQEPGTAGVEGDTFRWLQRAIRDAANAPVPAPARPPRRC